MLHRVFIALGSNLGDRVANLAAAIELLAKLPSTRVIKVAEVIETAAIDSPAGSPAYLNTAAELATSLEPRELLNALLSIEATLGRVRSTQNAPRPMDLDLLLFDDRLIDEPGLIVPHPRMHERRFVLAPLAAIAADVVHPTLKQSMAAILRSL